MKKFHIALSVADIGRSVQDYTKRLGQEPTLVIKGTYALWRTEILNFSIRQTDQDAGKLRHIGWEDDKAAGFTSDKDVNGVLWEYFSAKDQAQEIQQIWPRAADPK